MFEIGKDILMNLNGNFEIYYILFGIAFLLMLILISILTYTGKNAK